METSGLFKTLAAVPFKDLAAECKVFNLNEFSYFLWVRLTPPLPYEYYLYRVEEVKETLQKVPFPGAFMYESPTWMKVKTDFINKEIGQHTYKLTYINRISGVELPLYFRYIVQSDNPDKPYVYMHRDEENGV